MIKNSESILSFLHDREPDPEELYGIAVDVFERIKEDRHMQR